MAFRSERAYYRLTYPISHRPVLKVGAERFPVIDVSEGGMRFRLEEGPAPPLGTEFTGRLYLPASGEVEVIGKIVRIDGQDLGAELTKGVPFAVMMDEQRNLARRFRGRA